MLKIIRIGNYSNVCTRKFGDSTRGVPADEIRSSIAKKAGVDEDQVFVDTPAAPAIPVTTFSEEEQSVVLIGTGSDGSKNSQVLGISEIPLISALSCAVFPSKSIVGYNFNFVTSSMRCVYARYV